MSDKNPYQDAKDLSPFRWMIRNEGKKMIFSFLFTMIFIVMPWVGQWYIETNWVRYTVSGSGVLINFLATFLHPYLTWRDAYKLYKSWDAVFGDNELK
jgi:hypothetical protein